MTTMVLFPIQHIKVRLYLLQLENYDIKRFWQDLKTEAKKPLSTLRQTLIWTTKLQVVFCLSLLLYFLASVFISFILFKISGYWLIFSLAFITCLYILPALLEYFLIASTLFLSPIDAYAKGRIIAKAHQKLKQFPNLKIIGITGSYGKTTMKDVLFDILSQSFICVKTPENINTPIGIARLIQTNITNNTQILIVEMGAYYPGDIKAICELAKPTISILTGINEMHLERFGSLENTIKTKFEIVTYMDKQGIVVLNGDDQNIAKHYKKFLDQQKTLLYGFENQSHTSLSIKNRKFNQETLQWQFSLFKDNKKLGDFKTSLLGEYALATISGAIQIALELGLTINDIQKIIHKLEAIPHRLQPIHGQHDILVIDDSYNGNPDGVKEAIKTLGQFSKRRKIYITPGLVETGTASEQIHITIGKQLASVADIVVLIRNSVTPFIADGLLMEIFPKDKIIWYDSATKTHNSMGDFTKPGDVIMFQNDWPDNYQ